MTTMTLNNTYQGIGTILNQFNFPAKKSVTTFKKVISLVTDQKSVESSAELIDFVTTLKDSLPLTAEQFLLEDVESWLTKTNEMLMSINKLFDTIDNLFDGEDDIEIDDDKMLLLLANMKKAKEVLDDMSLYLSTIIDTQLAIKSHADKEAKIMTCDELLILLKVA